MTRERVTARLFGQTGASTLASGRLASNTELAPILARRASRSRDSGKMAANCAGLTAKNNKRKEAKTKAKSSSDELLTATD